MPKEESIWTSFDQPVESSIKFKTPAVKADDGSLSKLEHRIEFALKETSSLVRRISELETSYKQVLVDIKKLVDAYEQIALIVAQEQGDLHFEESEESTKQQ